MLAAENGNPEVVEVLLSNDKIHKNAIYKHDERALILAMKYGHTEVVDALLNHFEIDIPSITRTIPVTRSQINAYTRDKGTAGALIQSAKQGDTEVVKFLLVYSYIISNEQMQKKLSELMMEKSHIMPIFVKMLSYKCPIDVNAQDEGGMTGLIWAAKQGHIEVVNILLNHRQINVDVQDANGMTALIWAAKEGQAEVVNSLLEHIFPCEVHVQDDNGKTALM